MNCRQVVPLLFDDVEGLLPEREAAAAAAHLDGCPSCRRHRDAFIALRAELRGLSELQPPPHLARRAVQRWASERNARPQAAGGRSVKNAPARTLAWRLMASSSFAAALVAIAVLSLALAWRSHNPTVRQPLRIANGTDILPRNRGTSENAKERPELNPTLPSETKTRVATSKRLQSQGRAQAPSDLPRSFALSPPSRFRGKISESFEALASHGDDLRYLNGTDPVRNQRPWAPVTPDEWDVIEARVRRNVLVRDDFVQIAFPRIAGAAEGAIVAAVEQYKREAAIIDPRLFHEVTLDKKATALSDLCDHLRSDTGIQLAAGPSVADEKVTIFCEKRPLREVMRQLSRSFGYTWLRSGRPGEYHYELVQDLRSQLEEEELRNRDRDAALLALERDVDRYRPYLNLSPDEAQARAKSATPADKELLEKLAGEGWGPIHLYFGLSPQEQAALRDGQELRFSQEPGAGELPLPSDLARAVLESARGLRLARRGGILRPAGPGDADGMLLTAVTEARALVTLSLHQSELGRFNLGGDSGYEITGGNMMSLTGGGPYAVGISPAVRELDNATANASLVHDPALQGKVTVAAGVREGLSAVGSRPSVRQSPRLTLRTADSRRPTAQKLTSADILEALHRATGMPIVSDFYTRLYPPEGTSVKDQRLFEALNHLADAMRLRWHKDVSTHEASGWLQFRSASYYDDRLKEVPNRLLARWAASRREHGALSLDDLIEIAQRSDQQLDAASMAEGAKEIWGLEEWDLARDAIPRRHLRFLAQCTPGQRQLAISSAGLTFTQMSLAQQQQFISLAFAYSPAAYNMPLPDVRLEDLAGASLRVRYSLPGGYQWRAAAGQQRPADELSVVWAPAREAALQAARRLDPNVLPDQIVPSEEALTFLYTHGDSKTGRRAVAVRATPSDVSIW